MQEEKLKKRFGLLGATMIGVGAIVETTLFIMIGTAAGMAGPVVVITWKETGMKLVRKLLFFLGFLEVRIGCLATTIALAIYFDMLQIRSLIALPLVHLPLCTLIPFSSGFICIASGFFLISQTNRRS
ncbi:MAG: hypothetical protein JSV12_04095 [Candidatus Bathyarchaeota archaeon]|nr:MAG: hypothetical protein JSV12_04095 [Candidatus Bathyarchaeota archaeon]